MMYHSFAFGLLVCGLATVGAAAPTVALSAPGEVESQTVVFTDSHSDPYDRDNLYGFNHAPSVTCLGGEWLMAVWFSGPFEGSVHQLLLGSISDDGGKSWGKATVVNDTPHVSDFDPGFVHAADRLLMFFSNGRWESLPSQGSGKKVGVDSFQILVKASADQGRTCSAMRGIGSDPGWNCRSNGIRLSNGTLLIPTHHLQHPHISSVLLSADDGETWTRGSDIKTPGEIGAAEPSVAELSNGNLMMVLRTTDGSLWLSRSADFGHTWSPPEREKLPAAESSANVFCTSTGKVVLTHNPTKPRLRTQLTMRVLEGSRKGWSDPLILAEVEPTTEQEAAWSRQVSYPSVCELPDGTLLVVWARIELSEDHQSGAICSARVRLR